MRQIASCQWVLRIQLNEENLNPELQLVGNPIKLSRTPVEYRRAPPMLGQDSLT